MHMIVAARSGREGTPLALAEQAYELVQVDPGDAAKLAGRALGLARAQHEPEAEVAALHALAFARHELGDPRALRTIRAAVRVGDAYGLTRRAALARRRLALDLAGRGDSSPRCASSRSPAQRSTATSWRVPRCSGSPCCSTRAAAMCRCAESSGRLRRSGASGTPLGGAAACATAGYFVRRARRSERRRAGSERPVTCIAGLGATGRGRRHREPARSDRAGPRRSTGCSGAARRDRRTGAPGGDRAELELLRAQALASAC